MSEDGTWKKDLGEKDQIIALSTKVAELQSKLDKQVIALATKENKEVTPDAGCGGGGSCHGKRDGPYTVPAWRLIKKEEKVINNGKEYYWCTGDHYSGSVKHNGMYADHKTCNHNEWRSKWTNVIPQGIKPRNLTRHWLNLQMIQIKAYSQQQASQCLLYSSWPLC
jgi:hypothetical protein